MRQVAAVIEAHAQYRLARLHQRQIDRGVSLRTRMRLHIGEVGAEQLLGAIDRELLGDVDELAAAVVALAGIPLGVFVSQHRTLGRQHAPAGVVFGGNQFDMIFLALGLAAHGGVQGGIELRNRQRGPEHRQSLRLVTKQWGAGYFSRSDPAQPSISASTTLFQAVARLPRL